MVRAAENTETRVHTSPKSHSRSLGWGAPSYLSLSSKGEHEGSLWRRLKKGATSKHKEQCDIFQRCQGFGAVQVDMASHGAETGPPRLSERIELSPED